MLKIDGREHTFLQEEKGQEKGTSRKVLYTLGSVIER